MNDAGTSALKLAVPKPVRAVVGVAIGTVILTAFLSSSIFLAIYDLLHLQGIIPSLIWLLLIGFMLFALCKEEGIKNFAIKSLGAFSRKEFVQTINNEGQQKEIQYGYQAFGRHFLYLSVAANKIVQIDWHTGQGSSLAGRDVGDWHVGLWYEHGDPAKSEKQRMLRHPDWEVYIVGPMGPKEKIDAFGRALLNFLRDSDVPLVQGVRDCIYVRQDSQG